MAFGAGLKDMTKDENEVYIKHQMELSQLPPMDLRLAQPHEVEERCVTEAFDSKYGTCPELCKKHSC